MQQDCVIAGHTACREQPTTSNEFTPEPQAQQAKRSRNPSNGPRSCIRCNSAGYVVEGQGVPGVVTRPGHVRHDHPVLGAGHPRCIGLQEGPERAQVQRPPPPSALALVIARAPPPAHPTPTPGAFTGPNPGDQGLLVTVELHPFDQRLLDAQQGCVDRGLAHVVSPFIGSRPLDSPEPMGDGVSLVQPVSANPRKRPKSLKSHIVRGIGSTRVLGSGGDERPDGRVRADQDPLVRIHRQVLAGVDELEVGREAEHRLAEVDENQQLPVRERDDGVCAA